MKKRPGPVLVGRTEQREFRQCLNTLLRHAGPASLALLAPAYDLFNGLSRRWRSSFERFTSNLGKI